MRFVLPQCHWTPSEGSTFASAKTWLSLHFKHLWQAPLASSLSHQPVPCPPGPKQASSWAPDSPAGLCWESLVFRSPQARGPQRQDPLAGCTGVMGVLNKAQQCSPQGSIRVAITCWCSRTSSSGSWTHPTAHLTSWDCRSSEKRGWAHYFSFYSTAWANTASLSSCSGSDTTTNWGKFPDFVAMGRTEKVEYFGCNWMGSRCAGRARGRALLPFTILSWWRVPLGVPFWMAPFDSRMYICSNSLYVSHPCPQSASHLPGIRSPAVSGGLSLSCSAMTTAPGTLDGSSWVSHCNSWPQTESLPVEGCSLGVCNAPSPKLLVTQSLVHKQELCPLLLSKCWKASSWHAILSSLKQHHPPKHQKCMDGVLAFQ